LLPLPARGSVTVAHADLRWHPASSGAPTLRDVCLALAPGSLTAVIGAVGAGKSTLLAGLLGEIECVPSASYQGAHSSVSGGNASTDASAGSSGSSVSGSTANMTTEGSAPMSPSSSTNSGCVRLGGRVALMAQEAWIRNASVRDNIRFTLPHDEAEYRGAVHAAALLPDLAMLPDGDETDIGMLGRVRV
jgi:energy-coupling factor transporter ATP-binding protein EcfA2